MRSITTLLIIGILLIAAVAVLKLQCIFPLLGDSESRDDTRSVSQMAEIIRMIMVAVVVCEQSALSASLFPLSHDSIAARVLDENAETL